MRIWRQPVSSDDVTSQVITVALWLAAVATWQQTPFNNIRVKNLTANIDLQADLLSLLCNPIREQHRIYGNMLSIQKMKIPENYMYELCIYPSIANTPNTAAHCKHWVMWTLNTWIILNCITAVSSIHENLRCTFSSNCESPSTSGKVTSVQMGTYTIQSPLLVKTFGGMRVPAILGSE